MNKEFVDDTPTVLIVDDNPNNLKIIALILRALKYKIIIATNGEQAIELLNQSRPDLILLDIMMPKLDGSETCKIIKSKKENENLPIIFITALNDPDSIVKGFAVGGVDYITKPFNKNELISRVKTHLELKRTRDELQHTTEHLSKLNSLKDKMFSVIGHDLRSPLSSVKMTLEFLTQIVDKDDDISENLHIMLKTTDEVFGLLENLLGWAKSQSGNLSVQPEIINVEDVVNSVYLLNKGNLNLKKIEFKSEMEPETTAFCDLNTIKTVMRNLVSNAIKFTPENGIITVESKKQDEKIILVVKDSGVGMGPETIEKLFDPTQHVSTYGTNREPGSGLGLLLCSDYVRKNNGRIWVESEINIGTCFYIELPSKESI